MSPLQIIKRSSVIKKERGSFPLSFSQTRLVLLSWLINFTEPPRDPACSTLPFRVPNGLVKLDYDIGDYLPQK